MRKKTAHANEEADVNVTPLLDIVFIMLIFFIVTATFLREKGIDVTTPEDTPPEQPVAPPPALLLAVQEDGFVRVNNVRIIDPGSVKPVVQEFMAREPQGVVLVSAAPESESGIAVQVMDQAQDGGATGRVSLALQKETAD
jgi:biopolymer transport protein ExbD